MLALDDGPKVRETAMPARALIGEEEKQAVIRFFDGVITEDRSFGYGGEQSQAYEREFAEYLGGGFAHCVSSGTAAIYVALAALELQPGDEVIVPPISDPGGVMPAALLCLVPVPADAWTGSYNTGPEQIEAVLTERTRAVLVAHIAGEPCDMDPIMELARRHNLCVIEDAAQAHGALYKGRLVGALGHVAAFSTMHGKHYTTGGQGGIVYTQDEELHWKAVRYADRGKPHNLEATSNVVASLNFNLTELGAVIGRTQLRKLDRIVRSRRAFGEGVRKALEDAEAVRVAPLVPESESSYWFMRVLLDLGRMRVTKEQFVEAVAAEGIPANPSYRHLPSEAEWFREQRVFGGSGYPWQCPGYQGPRHPQHRLPNAVAAAESSFIIPVNERYGRQEIEDVVAALRKVEKAYLK